MDSQKFKCNFCKEELESVITLADIEDHIVEVHGDIADPITVRHYAERHGQHVA